MRVGAEMKEITSYLKTIPIFAQAKNSKLNLNFFKIIIVFFILWGGGLLVGRLIALPIVNLISRDTLISESISEMLRKLLVCGTQIFIFFIWVKCVEKREIKTLGFQGSNGIKSYFIGVIIGFCSITLITIILLIFGEVRITLTTMGNEYKYISESIFIMAIGWVIQSASEEIALRGWLIPVLGSRYNPIIAVVMQGVVFGGIHLLNSNVTVLSFTNLILSGIFFAAYLIYSENIWGVCGIHFAWNLALGNIYGYNISGFEPVGGSIFKTTLNGSDLFTGGTFGPEGGLITTIVLAAGVIILTFIVYKKYLNRKI
jgi:membrane protease YdiL (CAAX protease family)